MKKVEAEMRAEYKRSDFAKLERGKFFKEASKGTSVALIEPKLAKAFPTSEAVNEALRGLLALADVGDGVNPPLFAGEVAVLISSAPKVQMAP